MIAALVRKLRAARLRRKLKAHVEHQQWIREQLAWGAVAERQAEAEYQKLRSRLYALENPRDLIQQGSMSRGAA